MNLNSKIVLVNCEVKGYQLEFCMTAELTATWCMKQVSQMKYSSSIKAKRYLVLAEK